MQRHSSRAHQAYLSLRERITTGELEPGAIVSEASLAKSLGISRTPIGEALRRLAQEGLVDQVPRYGTIVREISTAELDELFEIREALEGMAAGKAAQRISAEALVELATLCGTVEAEIAEAKEQNIPRLEGDALRRFLASDLAFHMLIIASAGNRRLCEMIEHTRSVSLMFKARRGEHSIARVEDASRAHRKILDALERRDSKGATEQVVAHIRTSRQQSLKDTPDDGPPVTLGSLDLPDFIRQDLPGS